MASVRAVPIMSRGMDLRKVVAEVVKILSQWQGDQARGSEPLLQLDIQDSLYSISS